MSAHGKVRPALVCLTGAGAALARRLQVHLPDCEVHGWETRVTDCDLRFHGVSDHLQMLYRRGRPVVALFSTGIVIRALAPVIRRKGPEPSVLALAEDGSAVIPLLGAHRGGHRLALQLSEALSSPVIATTAADLRFGVALDEPPPGYVLSNPQHYKAFAASLLAGDEVSLQDAAPDAAGSSPGAWLGNSALPFAPPGRQRHGRAPLRISITEQWCQGDDRHLVYCPRTVAVGVGCERGTDEAELIELVTESLSACGLAVEAVAGVFSIEAKADEPAVHAVAARLSVAARFFSTDTLLAETSRLVTPSELVFKEMGVYGVAEGAALAAVGPAGQLVMAKRKSRRATVAIARRDAVFDVLPGRLQGGVCVVGLGPGGYEGLTLAACHALDEATHLVGYRGYLSLVEPAANGQQMLAYELGEERERVEAAVALAAGGNQVALVCSGDPGVYAMASLVMEVLEHAVDPEWRRVAVSIEPGVSAMHTAAARVGAPLGHDFCAISLSDLLTPWSVIKRRLLAAAAGDFVVAFYNPASRRRAAQLPEALEILRSERPAETPVVVARNLGRAGEVVTVHSLGNFDHTVVDMLCMVIVGSSTTRAFVRGDGETVVYTPRGYGVAPLSAPHSGSDDGVKSAREAAI